MKRIDGAPITLRSEDGFVLLETHIHTREISACSDLPAKEGVLMTRAAGYSGMMVTDHFYKDFVCRAPSHAAQRARAFYEGYRRADDAARRHGWTVLPGMELRYRDIEAPNNDYLIIGMDEDKLVALGDPTLMSAEEGLCALAELGCLVIQAHPFRAGMVRSPHVHGCEVFNAHPFHDSHNPMAEAWAECHPGWITTAGSDAHHAEHAGRAGLWVPPSALASAEALVSCLRDGAYRFFKPRVPRPDE